MKCPCCGSENEREIPLVDLTYNTIAFPDGRTVQVHRTKIAELAFILARKAGSLVRLPELYNGLWGINEASRADHVLPTYVARLRQVLKDSGWEILNVRHQGYIMMPSSERQRRFGRAKIWTDIPGSGGHSSTLQNIFNTGTGKS